MSKFRGFLRELYTGYKSDLSIPEDYRYLYGNPVQTVVPLDIRPHSLFIIGAYPSANFATIGKERDVPVGDNLGPFPSYSYFDGSRIRSVASGEELATKYLKPLGVNREECWITDLVRLFLFKQAHVDKYRRLGCTWPENETRSQFENFAYEGMHWLEAELVLAKPRLVITLGSEVAGIVQSIKGSAQRNDLLGGDLKEFSISGNTYPVIHLAHPGIVMRESAERNPWPRRHREEHIPIARKVVSDLIGNE
jgi:uracil-DNA glycosylase